MQLSPPRFPAIQTCTGALVQVLPGLSSTIGVSSVTITGYIHHACDPSSLHTHPTHPSHAALPQH